MAGDVQRPLDLRAKRVWVAGATGMVGSAVVRRLRAEPCTVLTVPHADLDLTRQEPTERWMAATRPDIVVVAAARVGGILANARRPADFLYDNAMIAINIMHAAHEVGVEKLLFLGSSCIYPREAAQPMAEDALLSGPLEPTNEAYAIAKVAGVKLGQAYAAQFGNNFISAMPPNLYGPNDNFDLETSHVLPAMIRKLHEAQVAQAAKVTLWGTGSPLREFMHVDDLADAAVFLLKHYDEPSLINVGSGQEISIRNLAALVADVVGYRGEIAYDPSKPDGSPRKLLDSSKLARLGWRSGIDLKAGIAQLHHHWLARTEEIA